LGRRETVPENGQHRERNQEFRRRQAKASSGLAPVPSAKSMSYDGGGE
jgi:hypothetical protein